MTRLLMESKDSPGNNSPGQEVLMEDNDSPGDEVFVESNDSSGYGQSIGGE